MARSCRDYISDLNTYIDGEAEIEKHLGQCQNCSIMVDTMRKTVMLCREGKVEPLPSSLEAKLSRMLKDRWEKKFGGNA